MIIEGLPNPVLLLDADANYVFSNPSFFALTGLELFQSSGSKWLSFFHADDTPALLQLLGEIKESGTISHSKSMDLLTAANNIVRVTVTTLQDQALGNVHLLTFLSPDHPESVFEQSVNIHGSKLLQGNQVFDLEQEMILQGFNTVPAEKRTDYTAEETEQLLADLKASNYLKDKILAIVAHDLRSPISSLKSLSLGFFYDELNSTERAVVRESLLTQIDVVSDLTENLLRWASLSFLKKDSEETEPLNLFEIVEKNTALSRPHTDSKNIHLTNNLPTQLGTQANKDHIHIVMRNLITNAVKYTPFNGKIDISGIDLKTHIQVRIADTGIGLSSEQLSKLFTKSHNNTYGTNGEKGIGLGLLLCKEYVELNGGKIFVSSEVNTGTTVILELPPVPV